MGGSWGVLGGDGFQAGGPELAQHVVAAARELRAIVSDARVCESPRALSAR